MPFSLFIGIICLIIVSVLVFLISLNQTMLFLTGNIRYIRNNGFILTLFNKSDILFKKGIFIKFVFGIANIIFSQRCYIYYLIVLLMNEIHCLYL